MAHGKAGVMTGDDDGPSRALRLMLDALLLLDDAREWLAAARLAEAIDVLRRIEDVEVEGSTDG